MNAQVHQSDTGFDWILSDPTIRQNSIGFGWIPVGFRDLESHPNPWCWIQSYPIVGVTDGSDGQIPYRFYQISLYYVKFWSVSRRIRLSDWWTWEWKKIFYCLQWVKVIRFQRSSFFRIDQHNSWWRFIFNHTDPTIEWSDLVH
jgi:hypothetical protein